MNKFRTRQEFEVSYREVKPKDKTEQGFKGYGVGEIINTHDQDSKRRDINRLRNKIGREKVRQIHREAAKNGQRLDNLMCDYFCWLDQGITPPPYLLLKSLERFLVRIDTCQAQEFLLNGEVAPGINVFGFADVLFRDIDGRLILTDWKCSKQERKYTTRACLQVAAYSYLLWLRHQLVVDKACIAIAMTDGSPAQIIELEQDELANWVAAFRAMAIRYSAKFPL